MTVLQLIPAMDSGGAEYCVLEQSRALVEAGQRVLVGSAGGRLESQLRLVGAEPIRLACGRKSLSWLGAVLRLRGLLLRECVDVVDASGATSGGGAHCAWPEFAWLVQSGDAAG
jgi:hypothetical protein